MEIKRMKLSEIKPALYNPRKDLKPGDPEYEKLKRNIEEFGYVMPLVWNKRSGNLVGGHQGLKILKDKGIKEWQVSVVDLDERREKALNVALNKIQGDWDFTRLADLMTELDDGEFDLELTGFGEDEIEELMTWTPKEPEEKEIIAFKKVHILLSIPLDSFVKVKELLEKIREYEEIEYEQSSN